MAMTKLRSAFFMDSVLSPFLKRPYSVLTNAWKCQPNQLKFSGTTMQATHRPIILCVKGDEEFDLDGIVEDFSDACDAMGAEAYPGYKKERLKKKDRRAMQASRRRGKIANNRVQALIDVVQYKRYYQYQK